MTASQSPYVTAPASQAETGTATAVFIRRRNDNSLLGLVGAVLLASLFAGLAIFKGQTGDRFAFDYFAALWLVVGLWHLSVLIEKRPLAILAENGLSFPSRFDGTIPWRCIRASAFSEKRYLGYPSVLRIFVYPGAYDGIFPRRFEIFPRRFKTLPADHFDIDLSHCTTEAEAEVVVAAVAARISAARSARPPDNALDLIDAQQKNARRA